MITAVDRFPMSLNINQTHGGFCLYIQNTAECGLRGQGADHHHSRVVNMISTPEGLQPALRPISPRLRTLGGFSVKTHVNP